MVRHFQRLSALVLVLLLFSGAACAQTQPLNILLIGVDTAHAETNGRSDAMILVRADPSAGSIRMVSFLRDLYVSIPGVGSTRLNAAYHHGGEALLRQTLSNHFDVSIDRTVTVHFSLLTELVDRLGGVEIELTERERGALNAMIKDAGSSETVQSAGRQTLNGRQALCYSRIRKIDSDFQRTTRQQTLIAAILARMNSLSQWELLKLALAYLPRVDTDLTLMDIRTLLPLAVHLDEVTLHSAQVPFPGTYSEETINGMMVLKPDLKRCRTLLQDFWN